MPAPLPEGEAAQPQGECLFHVHLVLWVSKVKFKVKTLELPPQTPE